MIRFIGVGVWVCIVAFGALMFGMNAHKNVPDLKSKELSPSIYSFTRTELFTVPVMVEGDVQGYVVAQLIYAVDRKMPLSVIRSVSYYINDEMYNVLFTAYSTTREVERIKFQDIKQKMIENVNKRFGQEIIKDVFVQQFGYIAQNALKKITSGQ